MRLPRTSSCARPCSTGCAASTTGALAWALLCVVPRAAVLAAVWLLGRTLVRTLAVLAAGAAAATGAASSMSSVAEQASSAVRAKGEENTLAVPVVLCARALCCRGLEVFIAE